MSGIARIGTIFSTLRGTGARALMPFICGGHPGAGKTAELIPAFERAGASIIEIGIPFSDPIADGPVIAAAMHEALTLGATPERVFEEVASVRAKVSVGLVAMTSVSIVHRMGGAKGFIDRACAAGFDGFIFPDAPLEEATRLAAVAREAGAITSMLIAPTTPAERAARIAQASSGFVYLLSRTGITGERQDAPEVAQMVAALRRATDLPIACGFGISTPGHVAAVTRHADAAIVGSAVVRRIGAAAGAGRDPVSEAESFVRELAAGLSAGPAR